MPKISKNRKTHSKGEGWRWCVSVVWICLEDKEGPGGGNNVDEGTEAKALTQKNMKHSACLDHRIPAPRDAVERNIRLDMPLFSFQAKSRLCSVDNEGTSGLFKNFICLFLFCGCVPACMCEFVCVCLCVHVHVCVRVLAHAHVEIRR